MKRRQCLLQCGLPAFVFWVLAVGGKAQSSSNGVYGGYVGSDAWFSSMRRSAMNQAMLRSLGGGSDARHPVPPDYVEFAGTIAFPNGNPFPAQRLPDLRIVCRDHDADPVARSPFIDDHNSFYTVFKKGQSYDLYWMYYFGSREKFASVTIDPAGPRERRQVFTYNVGGSGSGGNHQSNLSPRPSTAAESVADGSRSPRQPLTKSEVLDLLKGGVPSARVAQLIRQHGVDFETGRAVEMELRRRGAKPDLVELLKQTAPTPLTSAPAREETRVSPQPPPAQPAAVQPGGETRAEPALPPSVQTQTATSSSAPPPHADEFDLSAFPKQPTTFEEQQVLEDIETAATRPSLKYWAHYRLAKYYRKRGDSRRADAEDAKAKYWRENGN